MKIDIKIIGSMFVGAALVFAFMSNHNSDASLISKVNASEMKASQFEAGALKSCEVFFSDDRDNFEKEINSRLTSAKLLQSNVLWSETTKQLGFYALICY